MWYECLFLFSDGFSGYKTETGVQFAAAEEAAALAGAAPDVGDVSMEEQ